MNVWPDPQVHEAELMRVIACAHLEQLRAWVRTYGLIPVAFNQHTVIIGPIGGARETLLDDVEDVTVQICRSGGVYTAPTTATRFEVELHNPRIVRVLPVG